MRAGHLRFSGRLGGVCTVRPRLLQRSTGKWQVHGMPSGHFRERRRDELHCDSPRRGLPAWFLPESSPEVRSVRCGHLHGLGGLSGVCSVRARVLRIDDGKPQVCGVSCGHFLGSGRCAVRNDRSVVEPVPVVDAGSGPSASSGLPGRHVPESKPEVRTLRAGHLRCSGRLGGVCTVRPRLL